jgi:pyrroline-5-carboxylate reductase
MGSAFAKQLTKHEQVVLYDRDIKKANALSSELGCLLQEKLAQAIQEAEAILLAVKPQDLSSLAKAIPPSLLEGKMVISLLAGVSIALLRQSFMSAQVLLRVMPNLALTCGQGVIGLVDHDSLTDLTRKRTNILFQEMGLLMWMPEEKLEALTALTASGIGFVFLIIEAMMEGGVFLGFNAEDSRALVFKTIEGAIALLRETGQHPAVLKLNIASPGGTTIAGLKEMEDRSVRSGVINGILAAYRRGLQMRNDLER